MKARRSYLLIVVLVASVAAAATLIALYALANYFASEVSYSLDREDYESAVDLSYRVEALSMFVSEYKRVQVLCERGYAFGVNGNDKSAISSYRDALSIDSSDINSNYGLALNLYRTGCCEDAYKYIKYCDSVKRAYLYVDDFTDDQLASEKVLFLMADIQKCRGRFKSAAWYEKRGLLGGQKVVIDIGPDDSDSVVELPSDNADSNQR